MSAPEATRIDRRQFLALGGAATAVVLASGVLGACSDDAGPATPDATLPDADEATRAVGERYLAVNPEEQNPAVLRAALPPDLADVTPGQQVDAVDRAVREDFEADRITEVDGWLLSVTECRLAALAVV
ncbi:MAG: hypothetical protein AAGK32_04015 [Actinomycetota bacterium]